MNEKVKETILTITLGLVVLYGIITRIWQTSEKAWILYIAVGVGLIGITWPWLSRLIHKGWFLLADALGFVMSKVVLGAAFFLLVIPFGLLSRLFRKDLMFMKGKADTFFVSRKHRFSKEDFEHPW